MAAKRQGITWTNEKRKLSDLIPWERNPRTINTAQAERLVDSVETFGQVETLAIDCHNGVLNGHQRLNVLAGQYGMDYEVDVRVANRVLTERERQQLTVYLHRGTTGAWDFEELANSFEFEDLVTWGFSEEELLGLDFGEEPTSAGADTEPQIDKAEELRVKWNVSSGQLWALGEHRLICGDCTDAAVVARVMGGEKADMMFTDPPYGVSFSGQLLSNTSVDGVRIDHHKGANTKHDAIGNDELTGDDLTDFCVKFLEVAKSTGIKAWYVCFAQLYFDSILSAMRRCDLEWRSIIAWVKNQSTLSNRDYKMRYEPIVYGQSGGSFYGERYHEEDVWEITRTLKNNLHPTMKPVDLVERAVKNSSQANDIVYEPFSGSGTAIIACHNLGRKCRAVEISPAYVAVAIERFYQHTGIEPVLIA